jgi:hypothetical protein
MKLIANKSFNGQRVVVDGKIFRNCHFSQSRLVIEGDAIFEMQECKIEDDCQLAVEGRGQVILHMLKLMLHSGGWLAQVADNVLQTVRQPPKTATAPPAPLPQATDPRAPR